MTPVYVVGHKAFDLPTGSDEGYRPLLVGSGKSWGKERGFNTDDDGISISDKNPTFCELTAYYWAWKNTNADEPLGICHYRRYFAEGNAPLTQERIEEIFSDPSVAMIVPKKTNWRRDNVVEAFLRGAGYQQDLDHLESVIREMHPEYIDAFQKVLKSRSAYYRNMLIARRDVFEAYCEWMFSTLFEVEKITDLSAYNTTEKRVFGFLSEIMLNVFIVANHLKVVEVPTSSFCVEPKVQRMRQKISRIVKSAVKRVIWFPSGINPKKRSS